MLYLYTMTVSVRENIKEAKKRLSAYTSKINEKSHFYEALSDPTRLKIIYLIQNHKELCVSEVASILDISVSAVSHQARILEGAGILERKRYGKTICYSIKGDIIKNL